MAPPILPLKIVRGKTQQTRKPDSTLEEIVGMAGNSVHLVEGGKEDLSVKVVEEETTTGEMQNPTSEAVTVQVEHQDNVAVTLQQLEDTKSALLSFMMQMKLNSG
ncbi:hypothetical protein GUJ93_ZPchr0001g30821 [Zizania palustris]|uniref:Uncharacterized protein n=1 Tax=Zizania palustris TaxID=103762 RepID=A0A8J5RA87_ZIZPA|nr:hypothetical protein GUJ93_ZPchr0001g30821 [Zizania palustris]